MLWRGTFRAARLFGFLDLPIMTVAHDIQLSAPIIRQDRRSRADTVVEVQLHQAVRNQLHIGSPEPVEWSRG